MKGREENANRAGPHNLQPGSSGASHRDRREVCRPQTGQPAPPTVTVLIPAFNEEGGIRDTLDALFLQTAPIERIIVVDDCSTDGTNDIARGRGVEVIRTPQNAGSKARALNYVLPRVTTDMLMVVDADAILEPDYLEKVLPAFSDPDVTIAGGCVFSRNTATPAERGRSTELLFSFHLLRPLQAWAGAPLVIPGCACVYRRDDLNANGGWTARTVCEDIDYCWSALINGKKAIYVADAVVWTIDPHTGPQIGRQVNRWMSSVFQSTRLHWKEAPRKPMLALWVIVCILETWFTPVYWLSPAVIPFIWHVSWISIACWWLAGQFVLLLPVLFYAAVRRHLNPLRVLANAIFLDYVWLFNAWYTARAMVVELVLVPLGLTKGMTVFEKGGGH